MVNKMKTKLALFILLISTALMLASCDKPLTPSNAEIAADGAVTLKTQFDKYSPDIEKISFFIINNTSDELSYGSPYSLETEVDGEWCKIPYKPNTAWNDLGYLLMANAKNTDALSFGIFDFKPTVGKYRIVKEFNGKSYTAEFELTYDGISPDAPHGFEPLENLPKDYTPEENAILHTNGMTDELREKNSAILERFIDSISSRMSDTLRIVTTTVEGDYIIHDIICEYIYGTPRYTYRVDYTRDAWGASEITTDYYRFILADDGRLHLSEYSSPKYAPDVEPISDNYCPLREIRITDSMVNNLDIALDYFEQYEKNYTSNRKTVRVMWSPQGKNYVGYTDGAEFDYSYHPESGGYIGSVESLPNKDDKIVDAKWLDDVRIEFSCNDVSRPKTVVFDIEKREFVTK